MKVNPETYIELTRPAYVLEEKRLRKNLALIRDVAERSGVEIILAFKAYALWKTFPIFREYISSTTASSLSEARLAYEEFGAQAHTYSPAYTDYEIDDIARMSSHLTFKTSITHVLLALALAFLQKTFPILSLLTLQASIAIAIVRVVLMCSSVLSFI